ncbi:MAG: nucleoside-diphosphate kinase [Planctomycetes bacterium]|nr:nucleoside-diphosphate kinase [Planctomycetota bacterium]
MAVELAYALITPYSLLKSRTGGIISRLLSANLEVEAARMMAPSDEFVDRYKDLLARQDIQSPVKETLLDYCDAYLRPNNRLGISNRTMLLLFRGENAAQALNNIVGPISRAPRGDTIRGTHGDYVLDRDGRVHYFEPACLICTDPRAMPDHLRLLADFADRDGGIVTHAVKLPPDARPETTLVILKPDNFRPGSARPGNIVDMFARTGLFIVGARVLHLSVAQAEEFYGPLRAIFTQKLRTNVARRAAESLRKAFDFDIPADAIERVGDILKVYNAEHEFNSIVEYMTGRNPAKLSSPGERHMPGAEKCLALLYHGEKAIEKIRDRLGTTNPREAKAGSVRSVYGDDLMRNAAHASDSAASAERERRIIGLWEDKPPCDVKLILGLYLASLKQTPEPVPAPT